MREPPVTDLRDLANLYGDTPEEREALLAATRRRLTLWRARAWKRCSRCGEERPISAFGPDSRKVDGLQAACRDCDRSRKG